MKLNTRAKKYAIPALSVVFLLLVLVVAGTEHHRPYTIGFATPAGNQIWVSAAHFDNHSWGTPVGSMACCWEESGASSSIFDRPLPRDIYVNWLEEATNTRYEATVRLPPDLERQASAMPDVIYIPQNERVERDVYLIVGFARGGHLTVWLSNYPYPRYVSGRVLNVVGHATATITTGAVPHYPGKTSPDSAHRAR